MGIYDLWIFSCAALGVAAFSVALLELAVSLAEAGLDRQQNHLHRSTSP